MIRRGEGGGCGVVRAFRVARGVGVVVFPQHGGQRNRTRATLKALPSAPHRSRPYGSPCLLPDLPASVDAYWATARVALALR